MRELINIIAFLFISSLSFSQTGDLSGLIIKTDDNQPVPNIDIFLVSDIDTIKQKSNFSGQFYFNDIEYGKYILHTGFCGTYNRSDTIITLDSNINYLKIGISSMLSRKKEIKSNVEFEFHSATSGSTFYTYIITKDSIKLIQESLIVKKNSRKVKKVKIDEYKHKCSEEESKHIISIIENYKLDSVSLYEQRITYWKYYWDIKITRASITFDISLPNYHNQGLEELLSYAAGLIPKEEKNSWTR